MVFVNKDDDQIFDYDAHLLLLWRRIAERKTAHEQSIRQAAFKEVAENIRWRFGHPHLRGQQISGNALEYYLEFLEQGHLLRGKLLPNIDRQRGEDEGGCKTKP